MKQINKLLQTGFFHIFGAGTINKVLTALLGILLVRLLSKDEYGVYAYAFSVVSIFMLFNGLGAVSAILQFGSEKHTDESVSRSYYHYGYKTGVAASIVLTGLLFTFAVIAPFPIAGSEFLLIVFLPYPMLVLLCEIKLTKLRIDFKNKEYAAMTNLQTISLVVFSIVGALAFRSIGLIVGQCMAYAITYAVLCFKYPAENKKHIKLDRRQKKDYWILAINSALNGGLSQALTLTGSFLIGVLIMSETMVAEYKVATTIPFALLFIPSMVVVYIYPYFAKNREDRAWVLTQYKKLLATLSFAMGFLSISIILFADPIITLIFGKQYQSATEAFIILMIGFFITSAFRQPTGNLLVTQRRLSFNFAVGIISIIANVILGIILIPLWGLTGAAWAYTGSMIIGAMANVPYFLVIAGRNKKTE